MGMSDSARGPTRKGCPRREREYIYLYFLHRYVNIGAELAIHSSDEEPSQNALYSNTMLSMPPPPDSRNGLHDSRT